MKLPEINLDDEGEVSSFIATHSTAKGKQLANSLGMSGKGSAKLANKFSGYAWNKHVAINMRLSGKIDSAIAYESICDRIYASIPESLRPW